MHQHLYILLKYRPAAATTSTCPALWCLQWFNFPDSHYFWQLPMTAIWQDRQKEGVFFDVLCICKISIIHIMKCIERRLAWIWHLNPLDKCGCFCAVTCKANKVAYQLKWFYGLFHQKEEKIPESVSEQIKKWVILHRASGKLPAVYSTSHDFCKLLKGLESKHLLHRHVKPLEIPSYVCSFVLSLLRNLRTHQGKQQIT